MSDEKEPQVTETASLLESTDLIFAEANGALSELDQIMSDIEELQQEISGETGAPAVQAKAGIVEPSRAESPAAGEWLEVLETAPSVKLMEVVEVVDPVVVPKAPVEAVMESVAAPVMEPVAAPVMEPVAAPVMEPVAAPVMESVAAPVMESVAPAQAPEAIVSAAPTLRVEAVAPAVEFDSGDESDVLLAGPPARGGASLEETLVHLKHEEPVSSGSLLDQIAQVKSSASEKTSEVVEEFKMKEVHSGETTQKEAEGSLTMTLTGNMTLTLKYEFDGQDVVVGFKDHFLNVQLADGTEFKIPVGRPGLKRKAA